MCLRSNIKHRPLLIIFATLLLFAAFNQTTTVTKSNPAASVWELTYQIDRSQLPNLYYNDLTLLIDVGSVNSVTAQVDGDFAESTYNAATGIVQLTTSGQTVVLTLNGAQESHMPPAVAKATLLHNKKWGWSHGFDDNVNLKPAIAAFNAKNWQATLFMITSSISDTRQEDWIVDKPDLLTYISQGWSIGSHGRLSTCSGENQDQQRAAVNRLKGIVADSSVPSYKILSFAVPCFSDNLYIPDFVNLVNNGTDLQFYESGNGSMKLIDPASVKPYSSPDADLPTFSAGDGTATGLKLIGPLGRDFNLELGEEGLSNVLAKFDWMATHATNGRHFWYNTLSHGNHEANITQAINHIYTNYGPAGTDEAWVAPSDRIYSYILVRDNSQITLTSIRKDDNPPATVTQTRTPSPTAPSTSTPTTPTGTPSATPIIVTDKHIFLPLIQR